VICYPEGIETEFILNIYGNKMVESITLEEGNTSKYKSGTWVDTKDDLIITFTLCKKSKSDTLAIFDCDTEENPRIIPIDLEGTSWEIGTDNGDMSFVRYDL
jgi:hypothetical protein